MLKKFVENCVSLDRMKLKSKQTPLNKSEILLNIAYVKNMFEKFILFIGKLYNYFQFAQKFNKLLFIFHKVNAYHLL